MTTSSRDLSKPAVNLITKVQNELATRLEGHLIRGMPVKRVLAAVYEALVNDKMLAECTWQSVVDAVIKATRAGLELYSSFGHAWLVPFYDKHRGVKQCQLIIGYRGMIALAMRNPKVATVEAHVVYERDTFAIDYGSPQVYTHKPCLEDNRGAIIGAYAVIRMVNCDRPVVEWMSKAEIDAIRARSKAASDGPWATDYAEMARKTVVRRILKYCPLSAEAQEALAASDSAEFDFTPTSTSVAPGPLEQLQNKLQGNRSTPLPPPERPEPTPPVASTPPEAKPQDQSVEPQDVQQRISDYASRILEARTPPELLEVVASIKRDELLPQEQKTELISVAKDQWRILQHDGSSS